MALGVGVGWGRQGRVHEQHGHTCVCVCVCARVPFAPLSMEEAGPLKAGLLAPHPEDGGDPHDQHHHVLEQEEAQIGTAAALHLHHPEGESHTGCS